MPLGAIVARRFCGVWTIGNLASRVSHSKPLGVSGDTGTPCSAKRVLAAILRLAVVGLRVSAHTGRADTDAGVDIGLGLSCHQGGKCHQVGKLASGSSDRPVPPDSQMLLGRQGLPGRQDRQLSPSPHSQRC
jgi:hypothetical protein